MGWSGAASAGDVSPVAVQRLWEIDNREFAQGESELVMIFGEQMPRVVFRAAPSIEEAKAATDELKDVVENVYLSSPAAAGFGSSIPLGHPDDQPLLSDSEVESQPAAQAFKLLTQSPLARNVVASIVSDSNVWDAAFQNDALVDFLQTHKSTVESPSEDSNTKNSVGDGAPEDGISLEGLDTSNGNSVSGNRVSALLQHMKHAMEGMRHSGNKVSGLLQHMKHATEGMRHAMAEMLSKASCLFQQIFDPKADGKTDVAGDKEQGGSTIMETTVGQSFIGLAVLAILVILLKRASYLKLLLSLC